MVFNLSYASATIDDAGALRVWEAKVLAGTQVQVLIACAAAPKEVYVNSKLIASVGPFAPCARAGLRGLLCAAVKLRADGTAISWSQEVTDTQPPPALAGGWFNS